MSESANELINHSGPRSSQASTIINENEDHETQQKSLDIIKTKNKEGNIIEKLDKHDK